MSFGTEREVKMSIVAGGHGPGMGGSAVDGEVSIVFSRKLSRSYMRQVFVQDQTDWKYKVGVTRFSLSVAGEAGYRKRRISPRNPQGSLQYKVSSNFRVHRRHKRFNVNHHFVTNK